MWQVPTFASSKPLFRLELHALSWSPNRPGSPGGRVLEGRHVTLTPIRWDQSARPLADMMASEDERLWTFMTIGPFADSADLISTLKARSESEGHRFMAIADHQGVPMGFAAFMRITPEHGSVEVGSVAFGHRLQRSREGTEAIYLMLKEIFDTYGWRRAEWRCNANNKRSARAGERYGFVYEGLFRQERWVKGKNRDTAWFSMIDREWPLCRKALELWLRDDNFDNTGNQVKSLSALRSSLATTSEASTHPERS